MRGEANHRDLVNGAILKYEKEKYIRGNESLLMCDGKFNKQKVIASCPVLTMSTAEEFCNALDSLGNAFSTINKEDLEKLALYILHESKYTKEAGETDFSGYYTRGYNIGYGNIITDPFSCVCYDMLTDIPEYATIFGINARLIVGIVGLLSQGIPWEQVQEIASTHDPMDVMKIENRLYKAVLMKFAATHTFSQYCEKVYGVDTWEVVNIDQSAKEKYDDYRSHHISGDQDLLQEQ